MQMLAFLADLKDCKLLILKKYDHVCIYLVYIVSTISASQRKVNAHASDVKDDLKFKPQSQATKIQSQLKGGSFIWTT